MPEPLDETANLYDTVAAELELAAQHCRTAAQHARDREVPRMTAHAWAARGHLLAAQESLDGQAREHARRSEP
jgi:hypothetical protein